MAGQSVGRFASRGLAALLTLAGLTLAAGAQAREASSHERAISGVWQVAREDQNRSCRLTLRDIPEGADLAVAMPPGCRRALPVLAGASLWQSSAPERVVLASASGAPVLDFRAAGQGAFSATGPSGESYSLTPAQEHIKAALAAPPPAPAVERPSGFQSLRSREAFDSGAPPPVAIAQAAPQRRTQQPSPESTQVRVDGKEVPGRYAVLREEGRDSGCLVTLHAGGRAQLAPACLDQGLRIFDPVRWGFERGQIVLTARRGHKIRLSPQPNGHWDRTPPEGTAFTFRKI